MNTKIIINCTPHDVMVYNDEGRLINIFPKSDDPIRLSSTTLRMGDINGIPLSQTQFGNPENMPKVDENTYLIVSKAIKESLPFIDNLIVPNETVRNNKGEIIGCKSFWL